jgi:hypothetical protein
MGWFSSAMGALTDVVTGGAYSQTKANTANIKSAKQINEQAIELANTAHQRETKDLKAAGLNPVLSGTGGGGAGTPGLNVPTSTGANIGGGFMENLKGTVSAAAGAYQATTQAGLNTAQTSATQGTSAATIAKTNAETANLVKENKYIDSKSKEEIGKIASEKVKNELQNSESEATGTTQNTASAVKFIKQAAREMAELSGGEKRWNKSKKK